jgi:hypothetical protein
MKKPLQIVILITVSLCMNSCYYDSIYEPIVDGNDNGNGDVTEITYSNDIAPIFNFCANCHNGTQVPDLRAANAYNSLVPDYVIEFDAEASPLYIKLEDGHQSLPQSRLNLVKAWIDQGALE